MIEDKPIKDVRVSEVMAIAGKRRKLATVRADAALRDAAEEMILNRETRKVYVVDADGRLLGTITLETLLRHAGYRMGVRGTGVSSFVRMLGDIAKDSVKNVMVRPAKVLEDELIVNATKLMVENHLNDLPVVDNTDKLVGELNGLDILIMSRDFWS